MSILLWLVANWRAGLMIGAGLALAALGLVVWGQHATIAGQAETIAAKQTVIEQKQQEIDGAVRINHGLVDAFGQYRAMRDANDAMSAAGAAVARDRDAAVADIHKEIARAPRPTVAPATDPDLAIAVRRVRDLKAARAAGHHPDKAGAGDRPGPGAGAVPARP